MTFEMGGHMKLITAFILVFVISILAACGETTPTPQPQPQPQPQPEPTEVTIKDAAFQANTGKQTTGNVKLLKKGEQYSLQFSDTFSVSSGPDLHVWLLKSETDIETHISLAKLEKNSGAQTYAVPAGTDMASYKVVFIWCEQFGALFATAHLDDTPITPKTIFTGTFVETESSRGSFDIVQTGNKREIRLSDDFSSNGVMNQTELWLAKDEKAEVYVVLSPLKDEGAQTFDIPETINFDEYKYAIVWCADVQVVIGVAPLEKPNP
jgi:Electron transfer DM13